MFSPRSGKLSMCSSSRRGSAIVEASIIVPLIVLIVAGMLKLGITLCSRVEAKSAENSRKAEALAEGGTVPEENILRARWSLE